MAGRVPRFWEEVMNETLEEPASTGYVYALLFLPKPHLFLAVSIDTFLWATFSGRRIFSVSSFFWKNWALLRFYGRTVNTGRRYACWGMLCLKHSAMQTCCSLFSTLSWKRKTMCIYRRSEHLLPPYALFSIVFRRAWYDEKPLFAFWKSLLYNF